MGLQSAMRVAAGLVVAAAMLAVGASSAGGLPSNCQTVGYGGSPPAADLEVADTTVVPGQVVDVAAAAAPTARRSPS